MPGSLPDIVAGDAATCVVSGGVADGANGVGVLRGFHGNYSSGSMGTRGSCATALVQWTGEHHCITYEGLGLCPVGKGGELIDSGATAKR